MAHKQELAEAALEVIGLQGTDGYIDGSAEWVPTVGGIGGWGCHSTAGWELAAYLPPHTPGKQSIEWSCKQSLRCDSSSLLSY